MGFRVGKIFQRLAGGEEHVLVLFLTRFGAGEVQFAAAVGGGGALRGQGGDVSLFPVPGGAEDQARVQQRPRFPGKARRPARRRGSSDSPPEP